MISFFNRKSKVVLDFSSLYNSDFITKSLKTDIISAVCFNWEQNSSDFSTFYNSFLALTENNTNVSGILYISSEIFNFEKALASKPKLENIEAIDLFSLLNPSQTSIFKILLENINYDTFNTNTSSDRFKIYKENDSFLIDTINTDLDNSTFAANLLGTILYLIEANFHFDYILLKSVTSIEQLSHFRRISLKYNLKTLLDLDNKILLHNFASFLDYVDGVYFDRSKVSSLVDFVKVPEIQNLSSKACRLSGKLFIISFDTLHLSSENFLAFQDLFDLTHSTMDSYFCKNVSNFEQLKTVIQLLESAEKFIDFGHIYNHSIKSIGKPVGISESIASSSVVCAKNVGAKCIAVYTEAGGMVRFVAKYRPDVPIIALSQNPKTLRQLSLHFGVIPLLIQDFKTCSLISPTQFVIEEAKKYIQLPLNSTIILVFGQIEGFVDGSSTYMQIASM